MSEQTDVALVPKLTRSDIAVLRCFQPYDCPGRRLPWEGQSWEADRLTINGLRDTVGHMTGQPSKEIVIHTLTENSNIHGCEDLIGELNITNGYDTRLEIVYAASNPRGFLEVIAHRVVIEDDEGDYIAGLPSGATGGYGEYHETFDRAVEAAREELLAAALRYA